MMLKPITTEKAIAGIEMRNSLTFEVPKTATKKEIKLEIEKEYLFKVLSVNTLITNKGPKRAIVTFKDKGKASDVATKLKLV
ncbi:MAG: 50S ribosomal protein L23 [Candidatus Micrarchaeota archaeon]|nr:50S ribosomal protein L23 [Candidatus Micrarchaeota archaeon]